MVYQVERSRRNRALKRVMDIGGAIIGLLLLFVPLVLIGFAIRLEMPGPIFFRQLRVGQYGQPFWIHKFRTMRIDAPAAGPALTVGADPRITRVGRWLRERRLDEVPQLVDVLLGNMSLVGPRPEVPHYVAHYPAVLRERALALLPGITDPASLSFRNESEVLAAASDPEREYIEVVLPRKLALSIAYAEGATVWTDFKVFMQTLSVLVGR